MPKRGNGEGTIRRRPDGRWEARVRLENGERRSIYGETRQDVVRQLLAALRDQEQGLGNLNERQSVGDYLAAWIEIYCQRRRRTSYERYERIVRPHLIPGLGEIPLAKLTPQHVEAFYSKKLASGETAATVRFCHKVLRAALNDALRLGLVHRNSASLVRPPRSYSHEMSFYTEEQARTLLQAVSGDRLEALITLALATGMREGEILALTWDDVDLDNASLVVRANLVLTKAGTVREETKTAHSRRRIALPSIAVEALRRHRIRQADEHLKLGEAWTYRNLVFPNTVGVPYDANNWRRQLFYPLLKRAGLPRIRPHDLRHTAATLLLAQGVPVKVVSEMLGHANVGITLSIYSHVLPHMQQQAADTMDRMLRASEPQWGSNWGSKSTQRHKTAE